MRRIARLATAVSCLLALACGDAAAPVSVDRSGAIVNGTLAGTAYGAVGALLVDFDHNGLLDDDDLFCSGTLISPTVFLTAAHCVVPDDVIPAGTRFYVSFASDLRPGDPNAIAAVAVEWDPDYGQSQAHLHDLAVLTLPAGSTAGITPLSLPAQGALDAVAAARGAERATFINVGYGASTARTGKAAFQYDGTRQVSTAPLMALQPNWLGLNTNEQSTGQGGDCYGDSGGPKLLVGAPTTIYAIVVTGDANCRATSWNWRLDTPEARGFLARFVTLP